MPKAKLTPELHDDLVSYVQSGVPVETAVAALGVHVSSYYRWVKRGREEIERVEKDRRRTISEKERPYCELYEAVTRAGAHALVRPALAMTAAYSGNARTIKTVVTTRSETRLRRDKDGGQIPYEYTETVERKEETIHPADWRPALEVLRRRDRDHWGDNIEVSGNEDKPVKISVVEVVRPNKKSKK